jgi:hypothetical protein
LVVPA